MYGVLELRCGPSGIGKTTSLENAVQKPYTYTTRKPRNSKDSATRKFVSEDEFALLLEKKEIIADYSCLGNRYGFAAEIIDKIKKGETVSEQITSYEGFKNAESVLSQKIRLKKVLFLSDINEIRRRVVKKGIDRIRFQYSNTLKYLEDIDSFDDVIINPYSERFNQEALEQELDSFAQNLTETIMTCINSAHSKNLELLERENLRKLVYKICQGGFFEVENSRPAGFSRTSFIDGKNLELDEKESQLFYSISQAINFDFFHSLTIEKNSQICKYKDFALAIKNNSADISRRIIEANIPDKMIKDNLRIIRENKGTDSSEVIWQLMMPIYVDHLNSWMKGSTNYLQKCSEEFNMFILSDSHNYFPKINSAIHGFKQNTYFKKLLKKTAEKYPPIGEMENIYFYCHDLYLERIGKKKRSHIIIEGKKY